MEGRRRDWGGGGVPGIWGSRNWGGVPEPGDPVPLSPATPLALYGQSPAHPPCMAKAPPPDEPRPLARLPFRVCAARCLLSPLGRRRRRGARGGRGRRVGKMAEASPQPGRFFCHCCSAEIAPRLPVSGGPGRVAAGGRERGQGRAAAPRGRARGGEA